MRSLALSAMAAILLSPAAGAQDAAIGQIKTVADPATIERDGAVTAAEVGAHVYRRDVLVTGPGGAVGITFVDNAVLSAGPDSRIALESFSFDSAAMRGDFLAAIERGTMAVESGDIARGSPEAMRVRTPGAILAVRGTTFLVRVGE